MGTLLTILIVLASILLVLLVLMQNPKGGGLSTDFGSAHQMGGVKQTTDFIEKATWSLAGVIAVLSIVMTLMYSTPVVPVDETTPNQTEAPVNGGESPAGGGSAPAGQ
jgi:preprotein translocase subunit SecG